MAIATLNSHVEIAKYFASKDFYLVIGKTSAWSDEQSPPQPKENTTTLEEVVGYKKCKKVALVRPATPSDSSKPKISYGNKEWVEVSSENAIKEGAKYVYLLAEVVGEELPLGTYRQVGFTTDLQSSSGKQNLRPEEVQDAGTLIFYDNKQFQNRTAQTTITEEFIIEV